MEPTSLWFFDPYTGEHVTENGEPIGDNLFPFEVSDSQWDISNGRFYDLTRGGLPLSIGTQGPVRVTGYGGLRFEVQSQTLAGTINRYAGPEGLRLISGTTNVTLPTGDVVPITISPTNTARAGRQWVAYPQEGELTGFTQFPGPLDTNADAERVAGAGARLATPDEVANLAMRYALITGNRATLGDVADQLGLKNDDGSPDISGTVRELMQLLRANQFRTFQSFLTEPD